MQARLEPLYTAGEEIAHAVTHGLGLMLSVAGLTALVVAASLRGDAWHIIGCTVFGVTLVVTYASSTLYHTIRRPGAKRVLRHLDHAAVFLLIAGTYTPLTLVNLRGAWGFSLLGLVWGLAALGIALQVTSPGAARRFTVPLRLVMGWLVVVAIGPLVGSIHPEGLTLLVLGGLAYTLGVIFYAWRRPYHHAVWHVFVMAGSACHFSCVLGYVIPPGV